jgi:hypothetical protein
MQLPQKIRNTSEDAQELTCYSNVDGNKTIPNERVPSHDYSNYFDQNTTNPTGNANKTGGHGAFTKAGANGALPNILDEANMTPEFLSGLVTETELTAFVANVVTKTSNVTYVSKSKTATYIGSGKAGYHRNTATDDTSTATVKILNKLNLPDAITAGQLQAVGQTHGFVDVCEINFASEIGKKYILDFNVCTRSLYKSQYTQLETNTQFFDVAGQQSDDWAVNNALTPGPHIWEYNIQFGDQSGTPNQLHNDKVKDTYLQRRQLSGLSFYGIRGRGYQQSSIVTPVATSTASKINITARVLNWDSTGYSYTGHNVYSQSAIIEFVADGSIACDGNHGTGQGQIMKITEYKDII